MATALKFSKTKNEPYFENIDMSLLVPSETEPQKIRAKRYNENNLADLSKSIATQGILEPLIVRRKSKKIIEIVAGERRWRSAKLAGLKKVPVIFRELSDDEVVTIQLHENLHRENPHPLDEAFNYAFMRDELEMNIDQIALEVGKDTSYIAGRLKLANLPENIREAYENKEISLGHLQEIAKFPPEDHETVYMYCFHNFGHTSQALYPIRKAKEQIQEHYLLLLSKAPFPIHSKELDPDKKSCLECAERTGAHPLLFEESEIKEKDSCFNRECHSAKTAAFVQLKRLSAIENNVVSFPQKEVPVVITRVEDSTKSVTNIPKVKIDEILITPKNSCPYASVGIIGEGENTGKEIYYCYNPKVCSVHRKNPVNVTEEDRAAKLYQKEDDFQKLVAEAARKEVLKQIAFLIFKDEFGQTAFSSSYFLSSYNIDIIEKLWSAQSLKEIETVRDCLSFRIDVIPVSRKPLNAMQRCSLMFLLIYSDADWSQLIEIATKYKLNYQLIHATKQLELSPEEHRKTFHNYLLRIEDGHTETPIPYVYSEDWAKDRISSTG